MDEGDGMTLKELQAVEAEASKAWVRIALNPNLSWAEKHATPEYTAYHEACWAVNDAKEKAKYQ
jgi:hypothetical protein